MWFSALSLTFFFAFTALISGLDVASAQSINSIAAKQIDMAGRQRMLSQRIAKSSCFISTFTDVDEHVLILRNSIKAFEETHLALKNGNSDLNVFAQSDTGVLDELQKLDPLWEHLKFAGTVLIQAPKLPGVDMDIIAELNYLTLIQADRVVKAIEVANTTTNTHGLNQTINLAGRQRMLVQKAVKEFCFISYGISPVENKRNLRQTIDLLNISFDQLIHGAAGHAITAPPTPEINDQLKYIKSQWLSAQSIMEKATRNIFPQNHEFKIISKVNEQLLTQLDEVVELYVTHEQGLPKTLN